MIVTCNQNDCPLRLGRIAIFVIDYKSSFYDLNSFNHATFLDFFTRNRFQLKEASQPLIAACQL